MIEISDLNTALTQAAPAWQRLQEAYRRLPETSCQCDEPGVCCAFLPEMTWIEALQWMHTLKDLQEPAQSDMLRKFVEFYLTTPIRHGGCPFLRDGRCSIYDFRPFACRAYGLWSHQTGDGRTRENRRSRQALVQSWEQFGVEIPSQTVEFEIEYCDKVRCTAGKSISDAQLMAILKQIYGLDDVSDTMLFHAGAKKEDDKILTSGGRVIALTSMNKSWQEALKTSYETAGKISVEGMYDRKDIGFDL